MKQFVSLLLFLSLTSCTFFKQGSTPEVRTVNGMKFQSMVLPNKLEVLLVQDERFKKSSAAMAVMVGSLEDPMNAQGLAHYLEHMLFLGTKEFPKPDEYSTYMEVNGGWDNAYTSDEITNYMFEIEHNALEGGLQRFSGFFTAPLFDGTYLEREKNAVNNEFEKNIKQDGWRQHRYMSLQVKEGHPAGKFSIGNNKTLAKTSRTDVIAFYRKFYSANNMKLVVMSAKPLASLESWTKKYFSGVPNFNAQRPKYDDVYADAVNDKRLHFIKTVNDTEDLTVLFNIPDDRAYWESKPVAILGRLLGDEGKASLLSYLKGKGWALGVSAGENFWRSLAVSVSLTPEGRKHYQEVTAAVFHYIALIKKAGYPQYLFDDEKSLRRIDLDNMEPSASGNRAASFASSMTDYPVEEFLERNFLLHKYSKEDFEKFLSYLRLDNSHILVASKGEKTDSKEDIFGIEYKREKFPQDLVSKINTPDVTMFTYPEKNKYVPNEFNLVMKPSIGNPEKIELGERGVLYFQPDTELGSARGFIRLQLVSDMPITPQNALLITLYSDAKGEELREWAYPIGEARSSFSVSPLSCDEMIISVSGYTQRLNEVAKDLIFDANNKRRLDEVQIDEQLFAKIKERLKKDLLNRDESVAINRLGEEMGYIEDSKVVHWRDYINLIDKTQLKDVQAFAKSYYKNLRVKAVAYGNLKKDNVQEIIDYMYKSFEAKPLSAEKFTASKFHFRVLPEGKQYTMPVTGRNNNHGMIAIYKWADWSVENHARIMVLGQLISQPYFSELRTNQQLGYVARSSPNAMDGYVGFQAMLQSGKYPSKELLDRSDKFVREFFKKKSEDLTDDEIKPIKASLLNELLTKPNTLAERFSQFSSSAVKYDGRFKIREEIADKVKNLTAADLKQFIKQSFLDHEVPRLNLLYFGQGTKLNKKDLPGKVFEKPAQVEWLLLDPYKASAP